MKFFISSTYGDLVQHRKVLIDTLLRMSPEVELIAMEYFPSSELDPVKLSVAKVKEADAYIGIFGWRYGSIDKESKMSVTEVEYRSALAGRLPLLLYLASAEMEISPAAVDTGKNALRIKRLKKEIQESHTVQHFTTPEDLARRAAADIHGLLRRVPSLTKTDSLELPDGPVGPEVNPAHPFVLCHSVRLTKIEEFEEIILYVDLYYEEGTEEYDKTIASVDRVVYQLHETFPVPVVPMQNWRNNWILRLRVLGAFWVRAAVWFKDNSHPPVELLRYVNISHLPAGVRKEGSDELYERERIMMAEDWTNLAPPPPPLGQGKRWHVFLSYRSVNWPWMLALYDILNGLGYKVFLDQYVLTAEAPLAVSPGEALDASQSALLVWSGKYEDSEWCQVEFAKLEVIQNAKKESRVWSGKSEDSEWCKEEFAKLEAMQNAKKGFRYVIGRLDKSEITGLAAGKLWIDFSKQPEGPGASSLLALLYGLQGQPLPPAAVKLAAKVDEQMRDGLLSVKACRDAGDADALVALTATDDMAWTGSPMLLCAAAEGLIAMRKIPEALQVLDRTEQLFQKAVRPKQLRGLALARSGETMKAQLILGKLYAAGEIGPETLGILARTWMDRYNQTAERTFLLKSRDLYRQAFEAFPSDYYTGINAASKSLLAGEKETAAQIAKRVQDLVGDKPVPDDYWKSATVAEVQLLQGNFEAAARLYKAAVLAAPLDHGSHESSHGQAQLLLSALGATDEQKAKIAAAFPPAKGKGP